MIPKKNKFIFLTVFSIIVCFLSYHFCYFIAEKYFFDKFFYEKSIAHGYKSPNKEFDYVDYGDRAKDLNALENFHQENFIQTTHQKYFKIVIIGDSHVWGQGIKNNQRFAKLISNKLNIIRPVKVFSLGKPGNNTLDDYNIYRLSNQIFRADLYIIVPVTNDAILNDSNQNDTIVEQCQKNFPKEKPIYSLKSTDYSHLINLSWSNHINQCIVDKSLDLLPKDNAIYLIDKNYFRDNTQFNYYLQSLEKNNKYVISTEVGKYMDKYRKYFNSNVYKNFEVSSLDPHPNPLANQLYTDIIYGEITTNPNWGFIK